jgi:hypothetical protein
LTRRYTLPETEPGESDDAWCRRAAAAIPPEEIVRALVRWLDRKKTLRAPTWSYIGDMLGQGSGVSAAIAARYREEEPK